MILELIILEDQEKIKLTDKEIIDNKDAEITYLKVELKLVKKLDFEERPVMNNKI